MPKPRKGEKKKDYMQRCMSDASMRAKYPAQDQRYVVCLAIYHNEKPK